MFNKTVFVSLLIIALLAVALGLGWRSLAKLPRPSKLGQSTGANIACSTGQTLTTSPIDPADIRSITPLGNLNPPDHTVPTDHIYLTLKQNNEIDPSTARSVVSPGEVTLKQIMRVGSKQGELQVTDDFKLNFVACQSVEFYFDHVTKLAPTLLTAYEEKKPRCDIHQPRPGDEISYCQINLSLKLKAGEPIGEAGGGRASGLDMGATDPRAPALAYAKPSRYGTRDRQIICPLDLFSPPTKDELYAKLGSERVKRVGEPRCGAVNQDVAGTAQGNWYSGTGNMKQPENWSHGLALVHDNFDPAVGVVSIGGVINPTATKISFTPTTEGQKNRDFDQIKPDSLIYCYEGQTVNNQRFNPDERAPRPPASQFFLLQLLSAEQIKVELQTGLCPATPAFGQPTVYER